MVNTIFPLLTATDMRKIRIVKTNKTFHILLKRPSAVNEEVKLHKSQRCTFNENQNAYKTSEFYQLNVRFGLYFPQFTNIYLSDK